MNSGLNVPCENSDEYETPPWLFKALDTEFRFNFDAAAQTGNALCAEFSSDIEADYYERVLCPGGRSVWCNPPYSNIAPFVRLALFGNGRTDGLYRWVLLLPVRTGADWFHRLLREARQGRAELRFLRKRIRFLVNGAEPLNPKTGKPSGPRFESLIAVVG